MIPLCADEDSMDAAVIRGLSAQGVMVLTTTQAGMRHRSDEDQLVFATLQARVIFTHNAADFLRLHVMFMRSGRHHAGIIIGRQRDYSIGEIIRRLVHLVSSVSETAFADQVFFLSNW